MAVGALGLGTGDDAFGRAGQNVVVLPKNVGRWERPLKGDNLLSYAAHLRRFDLRKIAVYGEL